ncbi:hypothetical protein D3C81_1614640 [compost metagenome]
MKCGDFSRSNYLYFRFHQVLNAMLMRTEFIATMHEDNFVGNRLEHQSPVYCRVTATADQYLPAFEFI